jgi:hypothetical protein
MSNETSVVRIFNEDESSADTTWAMEDAISYVKQYMVYELQIKDLQESRRDWSKDFIESKSLPKKELTQALRAAKAELDIDVIHEIYDSISDMI